MTQASLIQRLRNTMVLSQWISHWVTLQRKGNVHTGLCPFHEEKTPSFVVNDQRGRFHCFGCGAAGDIVDFTQHHQNLSFKEALEILARAAGESMPALKHANPPLSSSAKNSPRPASSPTQGQRFLSDAGGSFSLKPAPPLQNFSINATHGFDDTRSTKVASTPKDAWFYGLMEKCAGWYREYFLRHHVAQQYILKRGLSLQDAERFYLGYAPEAGLLQVARQWGFSKDQLTRAGLLTTNAQGFSYAVFRNRLIFPIWDARGRVIAFGGRIMPAQQQDRAQSIAAKSSDDMGVTTETEIMPAFMSTSSPKITQGPKYLNSPSTTWFAKSHTLYHGRLFSIAGVPGAIGGVAAGFMQGEKREKIQGASQASQKLFADPCALGQPSQEVKVPSASHGLYAPGQKAGPLGMGGRNNKSQVVIVEGYLDVIALDSIGYKAMAPLGTALTPYHVAYMWRHHAVPILALDGDGAGARASTKTALMALPLLRAGYSLRFAAWPQGHDALSTLNTYGAQGVAQIIAQAKPLHAYLWETLFTPEACATPEGEAHCLEQWRTWTQTIEEKDIRQAYGEILHQYKRQKYGKKGANSYIAVPTSPERTSSFAGRPLVCARAFYEKLLLTMVVLYPFLIFHVQEQLEMLAISARDGLGPWLHMKDFMVSWKEAQDFSQVVHMLGPQWHTLLSSVAHCLPKSWPRIWPQLQLEEPQKPPLLRAKSVEGDVFRAWPGGADAWKPYTEEIAKHWQELFVTYQRHVHQKTERQALKEALFQVPGTWDRIRSLQQH